MRYEFIVSDQIATYDMLRFATALADTVFMGQVTGAAASTMCNHFF